MLTLRGTVVGCVAREFPSKEKGKPPTRCQEVKVLGEGDDPELFQVRDYEGFVWEKGRVCDVPVVAVVHSYNGQTSIRLKASDAPIFEGMGSKAPLAVAGSKGL